MKKYVDHKTTDGVHIINVEEIYNKIKLAARVIVTVENSAEVIVIDFNFPASHQIKHYR